MRTFSLSAALAGVTLVLASGVALACPGDKKCGASQCAHKPSVDLVQALNLTGDKAEKVAELQKSHRDARKSLNDAHHEKMRALKESHKSELASLLTPEEMAKVDAMHAAHKGKGEAKPRQCDGKKDKAAEASAL